MNETLLAIAVVIILIVGPFWLIRQIEKRGSLFKDRIYVQIRGVLREILLPLGFVESETQALGNIAKYKRDKLLVELYFDYREKEYSFFASREVWDAARPPRQVSITFRATQYNSEKKNEISDALHEWIKTIE